MPRGQKKAPLDVINEQLAKVDSQIENHQEKINNLKSQKNDLLKQKQEQELLALSEKIKESGKTVEEVLKAIE